VQISLGGGRILKKDVFERLDARLLEVLGILEEGRAVGLVPKDVGAYRRRVAVTFREIREVGDAFFRWLLSGPVFLRSRWLVEIEGVQLHFLNCFDVS